MSLWDELWIATALMLVLEGIVPFLSPTMLRRALAMMAALDDRTLRTAGFVSMLIGVLLLYVVH